MKMLNERDGHINTVMNSLNIAFAQPLKSKTKNATGTDEKNQILKSESGVLLTAPASVAEKNDASSKTATNVEHTPAASIPMEKGELSWVSNELLRWSGSSSVTVSTNHRTISELSVSEQHPSQQAGRNQADG